MSEIAEMCCVRIESNPFSTQKYGLKSTNDAPSPLHEPEKEVDKMICNDNSRFYMGLENRENISSIGGTEVIFTSVENHTLK